MKRHHGVFPVHQMAKTLGVSRSGYHDYFKRGISARAIENKKLVREMKAIFEESQRTYGSPRLQAALKDQGFACSRPRVARLMKIHDIEAKMSKRFKKQPKDLIEG